MSLIVKTEMRCSEFVFRPSHRIASHHWQSDHESECLIRTHSVYCIPRYGAASRFALNAPHPLRFELSLEGQSCHTIRSDQSRHRECLTRELGQRDSTMFERTYDVCKKPPCTVQYRLSQILLPAAGLFRTRSARLSETRAVGTRFSASNSPKSSCSVLLTALCLGLPTVAGRTLVPNYMFELGFTGLHSSPYSIVLQISFSA